jgi:hypothetical protein
MYIFGINRFGTKNAAKGIHGDHIKRRIQLIKNLFFFLLFPIGALEKFVLPAHLQNIRQISSDLQVSTFEESLNEFRIIDPADFFVGISCNLSGILKVADDCGKCLVHYLPGHFLPQCPFFVFPAMLLNEGLDHQYCIELGGVPRFGFCGHTMIFVI